MIKKLSRKVELFFTTQNDALDYIDEQLAGDEGQYITGQQVQLKANKNGSYYRVVLEYKYNTPAGIMETDEYQDTQEAADDDEAKDESEDDE